MPPLIKTTQCLSLTGIKFIHPLRIFLTPYRDP